MALASVFTAQRALTFLGAVQRSQDEALHAVAVDDLGGGFRILPGTPPRLAGAGWDRDLADGDEVIVAGQRFRLEAGGTAGSGWEVVLRRPLQVYAAREQPTGPRWGSSRIDLGGDPLGGRSATRDQIFVDPDTVRGALAPADRAAFERELGFARILPAEGEVFRLADRGFRVQAEVPGLSLATAAGPLDLRPGEPAPLASGDVIAGLGHRIRITLETPLRSEPVLDGEGHIIGYRPVREPTLVVAIPSELGQGDGAAPAAGGEGRVAERVGRAVTASLVWLPPGQEAVRFPLAPDRPNRFYGGEDRIHPSGGAVIPGELPDRELLDLFAEGFRLGALTQDRGFVRVIDRHAVLAALKQRLPARAGEAYLASHAEGARYRKEGRERLEQWAEWLERVARVTGNQVQKRVADYNAGLDPAWVAVPATATSFTLVTDGGVRRPAAPVGAPEDGLTRLAPPAPWAPDRVPPGVEVTFSLEGSVDLPANAEGHGLLRLASPLPLIVHLDGGPPVHLPAPDPHGPVPPIETSGPDLTPGPHAITITATYRGRGADHGARAPVTASLSPPGQGGVPPAATRIGELPFEGWDQAGATGEEEARSLWRAGSQPGQGVPVSFMRARFDEAAPGLRTLRVATDAQVLAARWNGVPVDLRPEGSQVAAVAGPNLLALKLAHGDNADPDGAGGVRWLWQDGRPVGLSPEVVTRSARPAVLPEADRSTLTDGDRRSVPRLLVEVGTPGLPAGTEIPIGEALNGSGRVLVVLPAADGKGDLLVRRNGVRVRYRPGIQPPIDVLNGSKARLARYSQEDPLWKPFQPSGGYAIYAGRFETFRWDRDAIRDGSTWVTYRQGTRGQARGEVLVVAGARLHRLLVTSGWDVAPEDELPPGEAVAVERDASARFQLTLARGNSPDRPVVRWRGVKGSPGPGPLALGDRIALPGSGLLLRVVQDGGDLDPRRRPGLGLAPWLDASPLADRAHSAALSLDADLQAAAVDELRAQVDLVDLLIEHNKLARAPGGGGLRGAMVALDAQTGDILAAATVADPVVEPAPDPWGLSWAHPGSTFKMVTALAALGSTDPVVRGQLRGSLPSGLQAVEASGSLAGATLPRARPQEGRAAGKDAATEAIRLRTKLKSHKNHPIPRPATLENALRDSSNTYFGYLSLLMHRPLREGWVHAPVTLPGQMDRLYPVQAVARRLGFGQVIDLFRGAPMDLPRRWPVLGASGTPLTPGDSGFGHTGVFPTVAMEDPQIAATGIGQGDVYTTPLQMARVAAAVATGSRVDPRLLVALDGRGLPAPATASLGLPEANLERVREGLRLVVQKGSAVVAFSDNPYRDAVRGKTGTAERPGPGGEHVTDSWFVGYLVPPGGSGPQDHAVAFACVLPGAGLGGYHAAEVIDRWVTFAVRYYGWDSGYGAAAAAGGDSGAAGVVPQVTD